MTVSTTTSRWAYTGNGSTTAFAFDNRIFATTDLQVYLDGVLQGSGYTVTGTAHPGGGYSEGTVTFSTAPASAVSVVIVRRVPNAQPAALPAGGPFPAGTVERIGDRATVLAQQNADDIDRSVRLADSFAASFTPTLPATLTALGLLRVNAAGTGLELVAAADVDLTAVTAFIATLLDDTDAATARATLGALGAVVDDTTPQLGGALDTNGKAVNLSEGAAVASDTAPDIWAGDGNTLHITGTTTITDFADAPRVGASRWLIFDGVLTFTHGSGITLPGAANITTAAGDIAYVYADAVDAFRVAYFKADGTPVVGGGSSDVQTFSSSGTWNKPSSGSFALLEAWGAGGAGGAQPNGGGGGGGGGYASMVLALGDMGATETVTIGAGGTGVTGTNNGPAGGNTTIGSLLVAYGGGGGSSLGDGGGGGGVPSAGATGGAGGGYGGGAAGSSSAGGAASNADAGGGGGDGGNFAGGAAYRGGGGGGGGDASGGTAGAGGASFLAGGGGGGGGGTAGAGGTSTHGGNGGAGAAGASPGTAGAQPGGGGGGVDSSGTSGAGGNGYARITVW